MQSITYSIRISIVLFVAFMLSCDSTKQKTYIPLPGGTGNASSVGFSMQLALAENTAAVLTWEGPSDPNFDHLEITWSPAGGIAQPVPAARGAMNHTITGLTNGTAYRFTMTMIDIAGNRSSGGGFFLTPSATATTYRFIYTADHLNAVRGGVAGYEGWDLSGKYILMADLDLAGYDGGDGKGWMPIGNSSAAFTGGFDGNNHAIGNLAINRGSDDNQGLFGVIDSGGTVSRLRLQQISITGRQYVGGVAGRILNGTASESSASGSVNGISEIGGLTGSLGGTVSQCYYTGTVVGSLVEIGGLVGEFAGGQINDSFARGNVSGNSAVGGLTGLIMSNGSGSTTEFTYTAGTVNGSSSIGGLVGINLSGNPVSDSYFDSDTAASNSIGTGETTAQMKNQATFSGWDFVNSWSIDPSINDGYPYLTGLAP